MASAGKTIGIIILIIVILAILAGIGYAIYYFFFKKKPEPTPTASPSPSTTPPPPPTATPTVPPSPYPILNQLPGNMSQVTIGADGSIWGLNLNDEYDNIYQLIGSNWIRTPGYLIQIKAVTNSDIYGCNTHYSIYHWDGVNWYQYPEPTRLTQVSASLDGTVIGINISSDIFQYVGGYEWVQIPGTLSQISVGSRANIWGLGPYGNLYSYTNSEWTPVDNNIYRSIAATADGTLWAVDTNGNLGKYLYNSNNFTIVYPKTNLIQIDAQNSSKVIGVDANGNIYTS